jgi:hypothetical protein
MPCAIVSNIFTEVEGALDLCEVVLKIEIRRVSVIDLLI